MKRKRMIAMLLVCTILGSCISACGSATENPSEDADIQTEEAAERRSRASIPSFATSAERGCNST